jgi:predicted TIM-barrel fold metal-dependent hydrolase
MSFLKLTPFFSFLLSGLFACGQEPTPKMDFEKYEPISTLKVPEHIITKAKFGFIDVHNHQWGMRAKDLDELVHVMDTLNMKVMVNLSGGNGAGLKSMADDVKQNFPNRFIIFANLDFSGIGNNGWTEETVAQLKTDVANGAKGLKIFKDLGFSVKDNTGKRVTVDDPRLDAIWETCADLNIPVLIHTADPKSFWDPVDEHNERWLEIVSHPRRQRDDKNPAPWQTLIDEQHRMFKKHPRTKFIAAHFGWYANDLSSLAKLLVDMPNVYTEFGAVIAELGRQPKAARAFFEKFQDRILFGKDSWVPSEYTTYFRVLETGDEYFPYHKKYHAFWKMYGMELPDNILKKIYYQNAIKIIPGIDKSLFAD